MIVVDGEPAIEAKPAVEHEPAAQGARAPASAARGEPAGARRVRSVGERWSGGKVVLLGMPCRRGSRPVRIEACAGNVSGAVVNAWANLTPLAASRSIVGVSRPPPY